MFKSKMARLGAISAGFAMSVGSAMAEGDAAGAFATAVTGTLTNVGLFGLALVGVAAASIGFQVAVKYIKKIPRVS